MLAARIARRLIDVPGVVGVMLGGSLARGDADEASDVDLGVFYRGTDRPCIEALRALARELDPTWPSAWLPLLHLLR
jgi:predicted nucleotidyltransferase